MTSEILIVDDDESSMFLLREKILRLGCKLTIHESCNGRAAIDFLFKYEFEIARNFKEEQVCMLLFLDINMPIMNGFDFMEEFVTFSEKLKRIKPVVVFMISSSENPRDLQRMNMMKEIKGFVAKYPNDNNLERIIKEAFDFDDEPGKWS